MVNIKIKDITKVFGKPPKHVVALNRVNLEIKDKEFFVLLGPSGSGKTTLLRIIAGLETPTEGRIYFDDEDVTDLPPAKRDVAMVFQSYAVYPHMKVFDNIAFPLKIRKLPKDEIYKRVKTIAEYLKIDDLLDRMPSQLSGGQLQRVALARALVREPRVFLLDEPLSNLDAKIRIEARGFLKRLQRDIGVTTIYVTHDQSEAMVLADRIAVLNYGIVQQVGAPSDLYTKPANIFVAGFIGMPPMNFVEGTIVTKGENELLFEAQDFKLKVPEPYTQFLQNYLNKTVVMGIRPQHVRIRKTAGIIRGRVYVSEYLGNELYVKAEIGNTVIEGMGDPNETYSIGDIVSVEFDATQLKFFDPKSQMLIAG